MAIAGLQLRRILSAELFLEMAGMSGGRAAAVAGPCQDRWTDMADCLAALVDPVEAYLVIGSRALEQPPHDAVVAFLAVGRGRTKAAAAASCRRAFADLRTVLVTVLDYAELQPISDRKFLRQVVGHLEDAHVTELRRRLQRLQMTHCDRERGSFGFLPVEGDASETEDARELTVEHLFPWIPSDDPWRRLLEALVERLGGAALVVHVRGWRTAPDACRAETRATLAAAEQIAAHEMARIAAVGTILQRQAELLRDEAVRRVSTLEGPVLAARVFVTCGQPPSAALLATAEAALDDASARQVEQATEQMFCGGARLLPARQDAVFAPLDAPSRDLLFGSRECSAILRTPMPVDGELPGLPLNRARTAPFLGRTGDDYLLGFNAHRDSQLPVRLDSAMRFRHTYVVGQTGTGKSTLLLHMILHDIHAGRGVAVLDPHGSLIDDIVLRFPAARADDLVLVDPTDVECPVGFNILRIDEPDPFQYQLTRDLVIDELHSYLDHAYDLRATGGPVFETHFRGMLGLLMGLESQQPPWIPNLMILRLLYTNDALRRALVDRVRGKDIVLDEFIREVERVRESADHSPKNIAPYITSKFTRFISDRVLRNITCQSQILDLDRVVNEGKVLLFYLGKGRFGDHAAGLLASQVVSRIRHAVMKRGVQSDARAFYLYADEFQLFADERFAELLAEARKFKLALTVAHQYVQQIPETVLRAILGNVGTTITFRVGALDGDLLHGLYSPIFAGRDLSSLANFRAYVRSFGLLGQVPFSIEVPPPPPHADRGLAKRLRRGSRERYGRSRKEVEREILETYHAYSNLAAPSASD